jgi:hypothetical protein
VSISNARGGRGGSQLALQIIEGDAPWPLAPGQYVGKLVEKRRQQPFLLDLVYRLQDDEGRLTSWLVRQSLPWSPEQEVKQWVVDDDDEDPSTAGTGRKEDVVILDRVLLTIVRDEGSHRGLRAARLAEFF